MNTVVLIGRLTKDPDVRQTESGMTVARFTLAVDRMKKDEADFISIVCFGKTAESVKDYITKGRKVALIGRIQTGSYEKNGQKVYTTDVIAERVEFCDSKPEGAHLAVPPKDEGFMQIPDNVDDEGLPFN